MCIMHVQKFPITVYRKLGHFQESLTKTWDTGERKRTHIKYKIFHRQAATLIHASNLPSLCMTLLQMRIHYILINTERIQKESYDSQNQHLYGRISQHCKLPSICLIDFQHTYKSEGHKP